VVGVNPDEEQRVQDAAARVECREFTAGVGLKRKGKPGENLQKTRRKSTKKTRRKSK
jgi:hypothetical protein